jgi:hypothetical protein
MDAGSSGTFWRRRSDVLWRRSLDSVIVLRPEADGGDSLIIGGSGAAVWDGLDEPRAFADLVADLAASYGTEPDVVADDVAALLADLEAAGYVERLAPVR